MNKEHLKSFFTTKVIFFCVIVVIILVSMTMYSLLDGYTNTGGMIFGIGVVLCGIAGVGLYIGLWVSEFQQTLKVHIGLFILFSVYLVLNALL